MLLLWSIGLENFFEKNHGFWDLFEIEYIKSDMQTIQREICQNASSFDFVRRLFSSNVDLVGT